MSNLFSSSIGRKFTMALSAMFLLFFLLQHLLINLLAVISPDTFNEVSHFMGYNPLVQYALQPVLLLGIMYHFVMGIILELKNNASRPVKYKSNGASKNSTWVSRNMIWTGMVILLFLLFHLKDFWVEEMNYKYICNKPEDVARYYPELLHMFSNVWRVLVYVLAFVFLGLHLNHGFQSAFQSVGFNHNKYTPTLKKIGVAYSIVVPLLYILIAVYLYLQH